MLPLIQSPLKDLMLLETKWKGELDPIIANSMTNMAVLKNVVLVSGNNTVPHLLQRMQQGWVIVDMSGGAALIYRNQPFNKTYLYLNASANTTVSIGVF